MPEKQEAAPVPRPELVDALETLGTATLGESGARAMRARVAPVWVGAHIAAPAYPVRCTAGDNLAIHVAVARAPKGSTLVVDVGDIREIGYWGEVLTTAAQARGLSGLVIDGGVRDVLALEKLRFPVFASTIALRGATKDKPGAINVPIRCGGVPVVRGDWVVGDADGVVVVPGSEIDAVVEAGQTRAARERTLFQALREGKTTLRLLGLDPSSIRQGADS
jgi:4-hydroxy-4-methyl-2-oxoglutarate aldolase